MDVERSVLSIIPYLLEKYDKEKMGVAIDVGVGTFNLYCEKFSKENLKTFAIEPLPSQRLLDISEQFGITLVKACLYDVDGFINFYTGIFKDKPQINVSSIEEDWWGVTDKSERLKVKSIKLSTLLSQFNIKSITYLKLDTEGSEYEIIKQLIGFKSESLPKILEFEYGGGGKKHEKKGGWNSKFYGKTLMSLEILRNLNYRYGLIFEKESDSIVEFELDQNFNPDLLFKFYFVYGNILLFREKLFEYNDI
jgi:FkbM family methyltransferase